MPQHRPPLNGLRVFATAARLGSFQDAARALGVTPGAVSRHIQGLEALLIGPLFIRLPRKVVLTPDGEFLLRQVEPALATLDAAFRHLSAETQPGTVEVNSMPTFAMHWLLPRLPAFHATHPEVQIVLRTHQGPIDRTQPSHLFIRRDPTQFSGLTGHPFLQEENLLVASPAFLAAHPIQTGADVAAAPRLVMRSRPDLWPRWLATHAPDTPPVEPVLALDSTILAVQAATQGLGCALIPAFFLADPLATGALTRVPGFPPLPGQAYCWLSANPVLSPACRLFTRWLIATARADG